MKQATYTIEYQKPIKRLINNKYWNSHPSGNKVKAVLRVGGIEMYMDAFERNNPYGDSELIAPLDAMQRFLQFKTIFPDIKLARTN